MLTWLNRLVWFGSVCRVDPTNGQPYLCVLFVKPSIRNFIEHIWNVHNADVQNFDLTNYNYELHADLHHREPHLHMN